MKDLKSIIERLRANIEIYKKNEETYRENEKRAQSFFLIEKKILSILNFRALFEELLAEIREKRKVPYVWLSLIEESELSILIQSLESSDIL